MAYKARVTIAVFLLAALVTANTSAEPVGLERGIGLFRSGDRDAALAELKSVIDASPRAPLAYYYTARIRYDKEQYSRAKGNILAALRDSSGFADAVGLLACAELKLGNTGAALEHWKKFTAAVGASPSGSPVTAESIMIPEDFRAKLAATVKTAGKAARAPDAAVKTPAAAVPPAKPMPAAISRTVGQGKYLEAVPVIEFTTRHHAQKPVEATLDRPWMGGLINALLGLVGLFTLYAFLKFGKTVEEEEIPVEPAGRRWSAVTAPAPVPEPERGYRVRYSRSGSSGERKSFMKKTESKPATVEALRDLRNRHAAEINRLLKRL